MTAVKKGKNKERDMRELLFMEPVFKEAIWGGTRLKDVFGYDIPSSRTGECWAISAHKNGDCRKNDESPDYG